MSAWPHEPDMEKQVCDFNECGGAIRFRVARQAGPRLRELRCCGRHLARLVEYMTVPGRSVQVFRVN